MKITSIKVRKLSENGNLKAVISVTFDNMFVVHDIKVIEKGNNRFLAMPSTCITDEEGKRVYRDVCHPINSTMRKELEVAVMEAYQEAIDNQEQ